jgi:aminoglycoside phosphotransferase family enzyme/predicted kinase
VFLAGERAYKVKKPVVLSFLDYGTLERRRALCRDEVRLNRRLAPRLYLGTVALVRRSGGFALVADDDSVRDDAVEFAVAMRRFDDGDTLAARVTALRAGEDDATRVGRLLAGFHFAARRPRDTGAAHRALAAAMRSTLDDLAGSTGAPNDPARIAALRRFLTAFMRGRAPEMARRAARGLGCDGHGDLRAEHVVLGATPQIVDCVEFDPALRVADVAADLAFLVMDLEALGAPRLGRLIVDAYRRSGGDPGDDALLEALACFRALVRAKVATVRRDQGGPDAEVAGTDARRLVALAERLAWRARGPLVIVCCGPAASGKSTLAGELSRRSGLPHLGSDVIRKGLVGVPPTSRAPETAYAPAVTTQTYRALAVHTNAALLTSGGAIVDATFHTAGSRATFRNALAGRDARVLFAECRAPAAVLERRAELRARDPRRISDATADIVRRQVAAWEAFDGLPPRRHLVVPAEQPVELMADHVVAWLDRLLEDEPLTRRRTA